MTPCAICGGDPVMQAATGWYCVNHLEDGLIAVVKYVAMARDWTPYDTENLIAWIRS